MSDTLTSARDSLMNFLTSWEKKGLFILCRLTDFAWGRAGEKFTQSKKEAPAVKASLGVREKSTRLAVFFGRARGGPF